MCDKEKSRVLESDQFFIHDARNIVQWFDSRRNTGSIFSSLHPRGILSITSFLFTKLLALFQFLWMKT